MDIDDLEEQFKCPRCQLAVIERFYGPCASCRDELAAALFRPGREVEERPYVPKVNTTPNFVATRE